MIITVKDQTYVFVTPIGSWLDGMMQKPNISNCIKICSLRIHYILLFPNISWHLIQLTTRFLFVWQESSEIHQGNHIGSIWILADVCMHGCLFVHCPSCWNGYGKRNRTSSLLNELFPVVTVIIILFLKAIFSNMYCLIFQS